MDRRSSRGSIGDARSPPRLGNDRPPFHRGSHGARGILRGRLVPQELARNRPQGDRVGPSPNRARPVDATLGTRRAAVRPPGAAGSQSYPHSTDRRVIDPYVNPVIGNFTFSPSLDAPIDASTGTKCSWVGSAMRTPGARAR